ncbi:MAG: T9SS type A sorting domain-containing protein, partial [Bacteroidales bacterium]|nr:T9SS type A sorting domain-containing protein [Bacteroidales bacterium]
MVPAAGLIVKGTYNYQQTVGETAIEIFARSPYVITQGFQQPGVKIDNIPNQGNGVEVYPNPARDYIDIELFGTGPRTFRIEIISFAGMIVKNGTIEFTSSFNYIQRLEISHFMRGFYFVRVISSDGVINRT